jgi:hypothetical protein
VTATIHTSRLIERDGMHVHPKTGDLINLGEGEFFSLLVESTEVEPGAEDGEVLFMLLSRTTMERVCEGMMQALNTHRVEIRRA